MSSSCRSSVALVTRRDSPRPAVSGDAADVLTIVCCPSSAAVTRSVLDHTGCSCSLLRYLRSRSVHDPYLTITKDIFSGSGQATMDNDSALPQGKQPPLVVEPGPGNSGHLPFGTKFTLEGGEMAFPHPSIGGYGPINRKIARSSIGTFPF